MKLSFKSNRNLILVGILGAILFFCMFNSCSIKEGMNGKKKKGGIVNAVTGAVKKVGTAAVNTAKGAAVGALNGSARAVGKSVKAVTTAGKIMKKEATGTK